MGWRELTVESEAFEGTRSATPLRGRSSSGRRRATTTIPSAGSPSIYLLHSMTSQARAWFNVSPFAPDFGEQVEALGLEAVIVVVDGFTAVGRRAVGRLRRDRGLRPLPLRGRARLRRRAASGPCRRRRTAGSPGKSSGGFGAMTWSMLRPDLFGGFATHAGDALFDVTLAAEFAPAAQALRNLYDGSFDGFWGDFRSGRPVLENRTDPLLQNVWAVAAAFSRSADGTVELPFRIDTGELVPEVFGRWLARDPVSLAAAHGRRARRDASDLDRCGPQRRVPPRPRRDRLPQRGIRCRSCRTRRLHFELFDGGHRGLNRRFLLSLPFLADRLG